MAIDIDTTTALRLPSQFEQLIDAIVRANEHDEADWIEWKSHRGFASSEDFGEIARHILAFSNRDPDRAAPTCEGHGYLVIGAEPGAVPGVTSVDPADLEAKIRRFLGPDGPGWSAHYIQIGNKTVVVFAVAPPRWGNAIHMLVSGFGKYRETTVFVRRNGASHSADVSEMKMLERRLLKRKERINVSVEWASDPPALPVIDSSEEAIDEWIQAERVVLMTHEDKDSEGDAAATQASAKPKTPSPRAPRVMHFSTEGGGPTLGELTELERREVAGEELTPDERRLLDETRERWREAMKPISEMLSNQLGIFGGQGEDRTRDQYEQQVEDYLRRCERALAGALASAVVNSREAALELAIRNDTESNVPGVQVEIFVEGRVMAWEDDEDLGDELPSPPRPWGTPPPRLPIITPGLLPSFEPSRAIIPHTGVEIDNSGSTRITFPPVNLRPISRRTLPVVHLLVAREHAGQTLAVNWRATSSGMDGVVTGVLDLSIGADVKTPTDVVPRSVPSQPPEGD